MKLKRVVAVALALGALCLGRPALAESVEEPKHQVLQRLAEHIELRLYAPQVRAVTTVEGAWGDGQSEGFRRLAGYIFGGNLSQTKPGASEAIAMTAPVLSQAESPSQRIAMTAPVLSQAEGGASHEVAFVMPSAYQLADLPQPKDPRVRLEALPARRWAVLSFSWWATPESVAQRGQELRQALASAGLKSKGPLMVAQYNPPWTLPFQRRNEVLLELE